MNRFAPISATRIGGVHVVANGVDQARVWDGASDGDNWVLGQIAPQNKPTTAENGAGNVDGTVRYRYTYYREASAYMPEYESGYSPTSDDRVVSSKQVTVTYADCSTALGYTHVRIYRQSDAQSAWYLIVTQAQGSTTYDDNFADASLVSNDTLYESVRRYTDGLPPKFRYVTEINGRLLCGGADSYEDKVFIGQPYPNWEHVLDNNFVGLPDWNTGLGALFEDGFAFTSGSVHRMRGVEDPTTMDHMVVTSSVGNVGQVRAYQNALYFVDPSLGPCRVIPGGDVDDKLGEKLRSFWDSEVNKDMLPFCPIVPDYRRRMICYGVATGTRPYLTNWCVFNTITNQWTILPIIGGSCAAGTIENQYGKKKSLFGTITGDIFQFGEDTDYAYGAYDGTLSGDMTAVAGSTFSDSAANFDADVAGANVIMVDGTSGDIIHRGVVVARVSSTQLRVFPQIGSTPSTSDAYYLGGIEAYWSSKEDDHGDPQLKVGRWIHINYEKQSTGTLDVHYRIDGGSWTSAGSIDMTGDGSDKVPFRERYHYCEIRIRQFLPGYHWHVTNIMVESSLTGRTR